MMKLSGRHWLIALTAAASVHLGVLGGLLWQAPEPGAKSAGIGGIEVSLGPAGGEPAAVTSKTSTAEAPSKAPPQPLPPVEAREAEPREPIVPEQEPDADPTPPEKNETVTQEQAEPVVDDVPEPLEPPPTPAETKVSTVPAATEEAPSKSTTREREPKPPEPPQPEPRPALAAESAPEPSPPEPSVPKEDPSNERTAAIEPSAGSEGSKSRQHTGDGNATAGGGSPGAVADYAALIRAWLERHKQYPRRAQLRRLEGTAQLYFVMNRKGQVLDYRVQQSSGSAILDQEVEAMIERAKPLPEMPEDMHQARLELIVPVTFSLR